MKNDLIDRFMVSSTLKIPSIIKSRFEDRDKREVYDDYVLLVFNLEQEMTMAEISDEIDECFGLTILYQHVRSRQTDYGQSICAFQEPGTGEMFKLNAMTNSCGVIHSVEVKIYKSLEHMMADTRADLERVLSMPGDFTYRLEVDELISYFMP